MGTTEFAGLRLSKDLDPGMAKILQRGIEHGYDQFISLVADKRNMSKEQVDHIAQGRVWIGNTAKELGLVDELGYLQDGIKSAAKLANLDQYDTQYVQRNLSSKELFWKEVLGQAAVYMDGSFKTKTPSGLLKLVNSVSAELDLSIKFNDPRGVYAFCLECNL